MLKLRTILLYDYIYYLLIIIILLVTLIRLLIPKTSFYDETTNVVQGTIIKYKETSTSINITLKSKEKLLINYYKNAGTKNLNIGLGDKIEVIGEFSKPQKNTTNKLFNYQKYLYNKNIFYTVSAKKISLKEKNRNIYYTIKKFLYNKTSINPYLNAFILGDKSDIDSNILKSYQENGISHLLAISGMHVTLLSSIILKAFKVLKVKEEKRYLYTSIILIFYLSLLGLSPSAFRGVLFFILFSINKIYYFYIKPQNIFILVLVITLLVDPYFIYDVGFQYSFIISLTLILKSSAITGNYLQKLLKTSTYSFLVSLPISLYNYYQINILSIFYNLVFVPLVSLIIFPLSIVVIIIRPLLPVYSFLVDIMEKLSLLFSDINIGKLIFKRLPVLVYIIYFIIIVILLTNKNKKLKYLLVILLFIHYILPSFTNYSFLEMIDVGQGDSLLFSIKKETILIDTGGKEMYKKEKNASSIVKNITIPLLKSLGITKIKYLILTHGDYDHMGEAINLVENFKVEKVIFNCGEFNELEQDLIKVLDKKKIPYYSCIKELNIDDNKLYFLNNKDYGNENDNSSVIYTELNGYKFMFMGDAGVKVEEDLIEKYNLQDIDVLKVGHHGSKTSSSKEFIAEINPKYSIISVGKSNRYGHPNKEVLENLEDSKIYRTDQDGSIMFKIKNNRIKIITCIP